MLYIEIVILKDGMEKFGPHKINSSGLVQYYHLLEGLTARASSSRRCRIYVVPTLVQLQGSHISQVYYTIAGQVRFGVRVIQGLLLIYNRYPKFFFDARIPSKTWCCFLAWKIIVYVLKNNQKKRSRQEKIFRQNAVEKERHEIRPSSEIVYIIVCTLFYVNMVSFNTNVSSCNATSRMFVVCTKNYRIWACRR